MSGHTSGPWTFARRISWENTPGEQEKHSGLIVYPTTDEDLTIAEVNDFFDERQGNANAYLIINAPDMYEALKRADRLITNGIEHGYIYMPDDENDPACETLEIIRTVLAMVDKGGKPS